MWTAYNTGDTRREASMVNLLSEGIAEDPNYENGYNDQREYTGYTIKKYTPMSKWEQNESTGAWALTDETTGLGSGGDYMVSQYQDFVVMRLDISEATQENIMNERMLEFAFEGQRYWDLLRQGVDYAASQIAGNTSVVSGGNPDNVSVTASNITSKQGLMQIPNNQITLSNGVLKQNAGW